MKAKDLNPGDKFICTSRRLPSSAALFIATGEPPINEVDKGVYSRRSMDGARLVLASEDEVIKIIM